MQFSVVTNDTPTSTQGKSGNNTEPDWDKINAEKRERELKNIEMLETQTESASLSGVISAYVDLGIQERGDFEEVYEPNNPKHIEKIEKGSLVKDRYNEKEKKKVPTLCTPSKPAKAFILGVDFPQYMVDYGGEIGERPFRMFLGGKYFVLNPDSAEGKKMAIVQKPMYMVENTNNPQNRWALPVNSVFAKMCVAAGLGDVDGLVSKDKIGELLGKALQFEVRVWDKPAKTGSGTYYTEHIKFVGKLPKGMPAPVLDDKYIFGVNMSKANNPEMLKQLRAEHKNTMKLATNWEGSVLQGELGFTPKQSQVVLEPATKAPVSQPKPTPVQVNTTVAKPAVVDLDSGWDDDQV